jgi:hypothetical protein
MITVFWDVTPCSLVNTYQRFDKACCLYLQGKRFVYLANGGRRLLKTLINIYHTGRCHTPEDTVTAVITSNLSKKFNSGKLICERQR